MCGFFITNSSVVNKGHESVIEHYLRFRGPDGSSGLVEFNGWKAYHSRLSIIDLSVGVNQPMLDELGGMLVFNGEILNYKELGYKYFDTEFHSDTRLLSKLLSENLLSIAELDGFFAFVYIDRHGKLTHAVRDHFGVKPLFYHEDELGISFCSEPNVLNKIFDCDINNDSIDEYYATRAPIFSGSYFVGIKSIEPGECLVNGRFFDCAESLNSNYEDVSVINLKQALCRGVSTRLVSDAPVGLLLSRGIDSNLLRHIGDFSNYYTIGFSGDDDIEYLKSQNIGGLTALVCSPEEYKTAFDYLLDLRGEPMSVPNEVLLYLVSKRAASDGIKVLLSGEGADEFFGGYDRIFQWAFHAKEFVLDEFLNRYCYIPPEKGSKLYNRFSSLFDEVKLGSVFETVRWFFIRYHMPVLFRRLDFSLMAAGVEGREPIANMHLFIQAVKISPQKLMGDKLGKLPLRELVSQFMGDAFAFEKKVGFPVDLTKIFDNKQSLTSYELWFKENLKVLKK
ncbi:asparagine synthetase B [Aeromonas veronii]|uniref:asparagine synthetase B family protein n=1 Tax=Aeromonas veronii TaxID=654 RepID=UPI002090D6A4|nr:asparagine synthase-related protein [Aeromonas veronii]MCO5342897.1 asparagine synthetase B [Aeromonas veronii]